MEDPGATEVLGRCWLTAELTRSGVEVARPERDIGIDLLAYTSSVTWMLPIQLKTVGLDGLTVYQKYVGQQVSLIYVLLADQDGGTAGRDQTSAYLLSAEEAWALPATLGKKLDPDIHITYRFSSLTRQLGDKLEAHLVRPGTWRERLEQLAPLR